MPVNALDATLTQKDKDEINEFISVLLLLPVEDRAILLSNAHAFKTRRDIERARKEVRE